MLWVPYINVFSFHTSIEHHSISKQRTKPIITIYLLLVFDLVFYLVFEKTTLVFLSVFTLISIFNSVKKLLTVFCKKVQ